MKIRLKNFRCYDDKEFDFGEGGLALITAPSGSGKSTILIGIYFALFGTGTKVVKYGKSSCLVELEFDGLKISRSKRPNRLLVNDVYEDQAGQNIINKKFGNTFETAGYISQNAYNSFILKSPIEKLGFLEKFAFKDVDLGKIKGRCKALISEKHNELLKTISQLEMATNHFAELECPKSIKFPLKCKKSNREKAIKNEQIKFKNCTILIKRSQKVINDAQKELGDLRVLEASIESKRDRLAELQEKIELLDEKEYSYQGDSVLEEYKERLSRYLSHKKLMTLKKQITIDAKKLIEMKQKETEEIAAKVEKIKGKLWTEYTKSEITELIKEYKVLTESEKRLKQLKKQLSKYKVSGLNEKKNKLKDFKSELEKKKKLLQTLKKQQDIYECPSCESKLQFRNDKLLLAKEVKKVPNVNINSLREEIDQLEEVVDELEVTIPEDENKLSRSNEISEEITQIESELSRFEDEDDYSGTLEGFEEYLSDNMVLESRFKELTNNRSSSFDSFERDINEQKEKVKSLQEKHGDLSENMTEDELRENLSFLQSSKSEFEMHEERKREFKIEKKKCKKQIESLKDSYIEKYKIIKNTDTLIGLINEHTAKIIELEESKDKFHGIMKAIEEYKKTEEDLENYKSWENKISLLQKKERKDRDVYASATMLKDKILEAESISMLNVIESINTHSQLYLDCFFPDNPISVRLVPFKETKKVKRPQVNIEIEYKGMECDVGMLSGGELSRVILAYTLALGEMFNIPLMLLDECTASLDQDMTTVVFNSIREHFSGKLILIIAHQVITGTFDKTIMLNDDETCCK